MAVGEVKQKQRFVQKKNNCRIHFADGDNNCGRTFGNKFKILLQDILQVGIFPYFTFYSLAHVHVNETVFSHERMGTKTRFEKEVRGYSETAYCTVLITSVNQSSHLF